MHSLKAAARAWQRLPAGPCAQGHRWYERACHCHCQCHPAPAIHDDNDLGMTVLAQGSHSTGPAPADRAGLMS